MQDWAFASQEQATDPSPYLQAVPENSSAMLQQISSGPDTSQEWVKQSYIKMITMAKESCYIQTPYFIPDASVIDALRGAGALNADIPFEMASVPVIAAQPSAKPRNIR